MKKKFNQKVKGNCQIRDSEEEDEDGSIDYLKREIRFAFFRLYILHWKGYIYIYEHKVFMVYILLTRTIV